MRNFKKGFVEEGSSHVSAGRTFKSMVERKNRSLSILSHLNTILNLPNCFEKFGKVLIFFRVKVDRRKRLKYSKEILNKPVGFWETIIWSDKSKFNRFGSNGKVLMWRTPKERFDFKCIVLTRGGTLPLLY